MHRARSTVTSTDGGRQARSGHRTPGGRIGLVRNSGVGRPAHRPAKEVDLIDGLRSANTTKFGRPVGSAHQQGNIGEFGLHDRRMQVHGRGPTGAQHEGRPTIDRETERHERR